MSFRTAVLTLDESPLLDRQCFPTDGNAENELVAISPNSIAIEGRNVDLKSCCQKPEVVGSLEAILSVPSLD